jgi:hypothetical protein
VWLVVQEYNINFDQPLNPTQVAANRAERIARDKKAQQQQQQSVSSHFTLHK